MALDEAKILKNKFIFLSYSHADKDTVKEDMTALLARGVRVWYDENMHLGDNWLEIAERVISHENCVGVLFYNSPSSLVSDAVQKEQSRARERMKNEEFHIWSVHVDGKDIATMVMEALNVAKDRNRYFAEIMPTQIEMFDPKILCSLRTDSESTVDYVYDNIAMPYGIVDNEDNFMDNVHKSGASASERAEIALGRYPAAKYIGPEQPKGPEDQRFGIQGNLVQLDGVCYTTRDLRWRLLYVKDGKAVLLCTQILTQASFEHGKSFLEGSFSDIVFSAEEKARLNGAKPRYMTAEDAARCIDVHNEDSLALSSVSDFAHWWIDEPGLTEFWKQTFCDGFCYKKGFLSFIKKGVRPILEVPTDSFFN
ncbi:MAG: toll/interleukin-1 receptor domain-containing protein [Clostridia bacterium]|nr:toll/interleukin-1 receptor domain-containing protein [Clostridia bacterium]